MQNNFIFIVFNTQQKSIRLLATALLFLNGLVFLYFYYQTNHRVIFAVISLSILLLSIIDASKKKSAGWTIHFLGIALVNIAWILTGYFWLALIMTALSYLAENSARHKTFFISEQQIKISNFFFKTYQWIDLQNVVLKDGLLTLDFKTNKLLQVNISSEINPQQEQEFNEFCQHCLKNI
jgi:hypothetical protein